MGDYDGIKRGDVQAFTATLRAFNPSTLSEVYNSAIPFSLMNLQQCNKFNPPLVWRGHVFVGTQNAVMMFGLGAH